MQVNDLGENVSVYEEAVDQLEMLFNLERESLVLKRKVACFSVDYNDDLVISPSSPVCKIVAENVEFIEI